MSGGQSGNASIQTASWNDRAVNNVASLYAAAKAGLIYVQITGTVRKDRCTRAVFHSDGKNTGLALARGQLFDHTVVVVTGYESDGQCDAARDSDSDYSGTEESYE